MDGFKQKNQAQQMSMTHTNVEDVLPSCIQRMEDKPAGKCITYNVFNFQLRVQESFGFCDWSDVNLNVKRPVGELFTEFQQVYEGVFKFSR